MSNDTNETFINIEEIYKNNNKPLYQIQLNNEELTIKHIGYASSVPEIIIKENFGKNNNLNLFNCLYTIEELDFLKIQPLNNIFLPILKLTINNNKNIITLSVKINNFTEYNEPNNNFTIYLTSLINENYIQNIELEKNINSSNIIEIMIKNIINCNLIDI